jgi:hypothetical protein
MENHPLKKEDKAGIIQKVEMLNRLHKIQSEREVKKMEMLNQSHKFQPKKVVKRDVSFERRP